MEEVLSRNRKWLLCGEGRENPTIIKAHRVYCRVAGADLGADQSTHGGLEITNLNKLTCGPGLEKFGSLIHKLGNATRGSRMRWSMKSMRVQPISIDSASQSVSLVPR